MRVRPSDRTSPACADADATRRRAAAHTSARFVFALALCALFASGGALAQSQQNGGDDPRKTEQELDRVAKENGIQRPPAINAKPLADVTLKGKELFDQGKLNLDVPLDLTATTELNEDGTFKPETVKLEASRSDENTLMLAQQFLTALSQSKVFGALRGAKEARLSLRLDSQSLSVKIASELPREEDAANYASGYGLMLALARQNKRGTDEGEIYDSIKFDNDGKLFLLSFEMPRGVAERVFADLLAKKAAARGGY